MADQARDLVGRQARRGLESARIPVDVVVPPIAAEVVVELADFNASVPSEPLLELAPFSALVAVVGKREGLDLAGDVFQDGRGWSVRRGAKDIAVGFWGGIGLAGCFAGRFVSAPVASLAFGAAVFGSLACTARVSAQVRTRGIETGFRYGRSYTFLRFKSRDGECTST